MSATSRLIGIVMALSLSPHGAVAQDKAARGERLVTCVESKNVLEFDFIARDKARLKRIEGAEISLFSDLNQPDWNVRFAMEEGAPFFHVTNARGAKLALLLPPKTTRTIGKMTWNDPPGARVDLLCDLSAPLPWQW